MADGAVLLKEAPELMAIGEYTERIPQRPSSLPRGCTLGQVMAFGTRNRQKVHWFVAKSEEEVRYLPFYLCTSINFYIQMNRIKLNGSNFF